MMSEFRGTIHHSHYRVYYEDTDAGGVVYYANYLKFAERARTDALRALGIHQSNLWEKEHIGFVVTGCHLRFKGSARLDDELRVETQLKELKKVRMSMRQIIYRDTALLVELEVDIACVDRHFKPARIPDAIVQALSGQMLDTYSGEESYG